MRRHSGASGKPARSRRPKSSKSKSRNAQKSAHRTAPSPAGAASGSSAAEKETEVARLGRELSEAMEQHAAASEVLGAISSSRGELAPVFDTILANALRLCDADTGHVLRAEAGALQIAAMRGGRPEYVEYLHERGPWRPAPHGAPVQAMEQRAPIQIADLSQTAGYAAGESATVAAVKLGGLRALLVVPMIADERAIGVIVIYRRIVRPFSDKQVALVQNFAKQAVIAIENARLLSELRQSLEQQTATADVLRVISSSPGQLEPVFEALLQNAVRICNAQFGNLALLEGDGFRFVAQYGAPPKYRDARQREPFVRWNTRGNLERVIKTKQAVHVADVAAEEPHSALATLAGARTLVNVPMLKDDELVGIIGIYHQEVRPFTDKQIELLQNFAAQAVIAIENARLLSELKQSLQEQTATSEVLRVISSSPGDLDPVFETMLENAVRICHADFGNIYRWDGDALHLVATRNTPPAFAEARRRSPFRPTASDPVGRMIAAKTTIHVSDVTGYPLSGEKRDLQSVAAIELGGVKTSLSVPMLREGDLIGAFVLSRQEVKPFTENQIKLATNFASQAVIAIENARLLNELRERTAQLEVQSQQVVKLNQQLEQRVADQVGEIERMKRLRRFLPPQVADLIVASGSEKQLESHRREITALFCDLRGFTGFSETADPEDVSALLREYHAAIGEKIIKYSGTLERYAGDGVMVVFNDPVPVENPALQAVLMALEMRDAIGALTETWRRLGHEIGFGIGIAHGFATLGTIGFEGRFDYAAIGTVSNVASRLCDEAKPGQILISPRVLMKVENAVKVEPVGEFALKGIRRPLAAYNVLAAVSASA